MEFKFEEGQRVIVPGLKEKLQGIIFARTSFLDKTLQPTIYVRWLDDDATIASSVFDQDVLERAQPGFVTALPMTSALLRGIVGEKIAAIRKRKRKKHGRKKSRSKR